MIERIWEGVEMGELLRLYRDILRLHTLLPSGAQRYIGDQYVKAEFRDHAKKATTAQMKEFCQAWTGYHQILAEQLHDQNLHPVGSDLAPELKEKLSKEQQLDVDRLKEELGKSKQF